MIPYHAFDVQILNDHCAALPNDCCRQLVQRILPLAGDTVMQLGEFTLGLQAIRRAFHLA